MKSVGQLLQAGRSAKKMEIADVARITRIRSEFLQALEADDYSRLPGNTVARGFIKNYAQFLGLPVDQILAVFRRDFMENPKGQIIPRGITTPMTDISVWTPKTTGIAVVIMLVTLFGAYLVYQYRILTGAPPLSITRPIDQFKTSEKSVEIIGTTDPQATLSVNGQLVALDKGGTFSFRVPLEFEVNKISVVVASKYGKTKSQNLTIYHE
ncbi:MAG: helix-turn-helix domain-containing protein [Patescibacteria group bacterium]